MTREAALQALAAAMRAEEDARSAVRSAMADQARLLAELRELGLPTTRVVHRVAADRGLILPVADRLRFAECLRRRAQRTTERRADSSAPHRHHGIASSSSPRAMEPSTEGDAMPRIIKRTTTTVEELLDDKNLAGLDDAEDDDPEAEDGGGEDESEEQPERRRRR